VDPARAEAVLEDLAELFRVALAEAGASVSLAEEIDLAQRYLAIEQVRFGAAPAGAAGTSTRACTPPACRRWCCSRWWKTPCATASSLRCDGGRIHIEAVANRGQVVLVVQQHRGPEPGSPGHGMALHNVRERLRLLHDVAANATWRDERASTPA
jgi:two-component system sensor histidine kinase AlgZ